MSTKLRARVYPFICVVGVASCGGGGGGGNSPPPPANPPVDSAAPDTSFVSTPPATTNNRQATFGLKSNETGVTFETSLNSGPFTPVPSLFLFDSLPDGPYFLSARARDAAGNVDATPATFQWTVDNQAPDTVITPSTSTPSNSSAATFTLTATENGVTLEASVDGGAYSTATATLSLTGLTEGTHSISARAVDVAGNVDATPANLRWTVDTQAPDTTITPAASSPSSSTAASFTLTATENGGTFEASLDGGAYSTVTAALSLTGLAEGTHSISVRAIDAATNVDPTPATVAWQVDLTPPAVRVVFPTSVSYTDATLLHVRGTAQDANGVASLRVNGIAAVSTDAFAHWSVAVPLQVGNNTLAVSATDMPGNTDATAASVSVANRGAVANDVMSLAFDSSGGRVLMTDPERRALLAVRVSDRSVSVLSDASRGSGTVMQQPYGLTLDGARALVTDASLDTLVAIDLATGNRTTLSPSPAQLDLIVGFAMVYHAPTQRVFVGTLDGTIIAIDLANGGTRTTFSGGSAGTGPAFGNIRGLAIDTSSGAARLLAADSAAHAIIAVDLTTGNRSMVSYAAPLDPSHQVGTGPSVYNLGQLAVDTAAHRVLVPDLSSNFFVGRLFSIDLATGNRTVLATSTTERELRIPTSLAFDATDSQVYVGTSERARIARYDIAGAQLSPFVDSDVGTGYVLSHPSGVLLDRASGNAVLYSTTLYPVATLYRTHTTTSTRYTVTNYPGTGGAPTLKDPGNLVRDTRAGMTNKALLLDTLFMPALTLYGVDLTSGSLSVAASAQLPDSRRMSRMALDAERNRVIVGLMPANGAGSIEAMDITTGALTTLASLSVGGGPAMYEIGAVAAVPSTFGTTARVLVAANNNLLAVNGQGDRSFIAAGANIGSGPTLITIGDMVVDFPRNRALVVGATEQAMQWVDLTSGNRTMASGRNPDSQALTGAGPSIFGQPTRLAADFETNIAYVTVMQTAILAVDLDSGDRVIMSR